MELKEELYRLGREEPEVLLNKMERAGLSEIEMKIVRLRYIECQGFKQIDYIINYSEDGRKKAHTRACNKIIKRFKVSDFLE